MSDGDKAYKYVIPRHFNGQTTKDYLLKMLRVGFGTETIDPSSFTVHLECFWHLKQGPCRWLKFELPKKKKIKLSNQAIRLIKVCWMRWFDYCLKCKDIVRIEMLTALLHWLFETKKFRIALTNESRITVECDYKPIRLIDFVNKSYKKEKNANEIKFDDVKDAYNASEVAINSNENIDLKDSFANIKFKENNEFDATIQYISFNPFGKDFKSGFNFIREYDSSNNSTKSSIFVPMINLAFEVNDVKDGFENPLYCEEVKSLFEYYILELPYLILPNVSLDSIRLHIIMLQKASILCGGIF